MRKVLSLVLLSSFGAYAEAQQNQVTAQQFNVAPTNQAPNVTNANAVSDFEAGSTTRFYWIVTHLAGVASTPVQTSDTKGPVTLSNVNGGRVTVTWSSPNPAATFDVLETSSATLPLVVNCNCAVGTGITGTAITDIGTYSSYNTLFPQGFSWNIQQTYGSNTPSLNFIYNGATICSIAPNNSSTCGAPSGGTVPALPGGSQFYLATSCPSSTPNCFTVNDNGLIVTDATFNSTTTVTTTAGDVSFQCPGSSFPCSTPGPNSDVGKIEWGTTNCNFSVVGGCTVACPQGTISTVNSAHSVTVSVACIANSTGTISVFQWGSDDGSQIVAAVTAMKALQTNRSGVPSNLLLPCGIMMTSLNPFNMNVGATTTPFLFSVTGCGSGTVIMPTPKMNCSVGSGHGCLIDAPSSYSNTGGAVASVFRDITFFGGGTDTHDAAATVTANSSGVYINFQNKLDNVWVLGWLWNDSVSSLVGIQNVGGVMDNSGSFTGGTISCRFRGNLSTIAQAYGGTCGGSQGDAIEVAQTANALDTTDLFGMYDQGSRAGRGVAVQSGILHDYSALHASAIDVASGSVAYFNGATMLNIAITVEGILHYTDTQFTGNANIVQTSGSVFDECGNGIPSATFSSFTNLFPCPLLPVFNQQLQGANVTVTASATTVMTQAVTFPANGCPCRVFISYSLYPSYSGVTNEPQQSVWVSDGTNTFATIQTGESNASTGAATSMSFAGYSPVTYSNNASKIFTLLAQQTTGSTFLLNAAPGVGAGANASFQVVVISGK